MNLDFIIITILFIIIWCKKKRKRKTKSFTKRNQQRSIWSPSNDLMRIWVFFFLSLKIATNHHHRPERWNDLFDYLWIINKIKKFLMIKIRSLTLFFTKKKKNLPVAACVCVYVAIIFIIIMLIWSDWCSLIHLILFTWLLLIVNRNNPDEFYFQFSTSKKKKKNVHQIFWHLWKKKNWKWKTKQQFQCHNFIW